MNPFRRHVEFYVEQYLRGQRVEHEVTKENEDGSTSSEMVPTLKTLMGYIHHWGNDFFQDEMGNYIPCIVVVVEDLATGKFYKLDPESIQVLNVNSKIEES